MIGKIFIKYTKKNSWLPIDIAVACFLLGEVWMLVSDRIVRFFTPASYQLVSGDLFKNILYLCCTALLTFYVIYRYKAELKKRAKALDTTNRDLETFIYKSSHDLRGPIASIKGLLHLAKMDIKDPEALE